MKSETSPNLNLDLSQPFNLGPATLDPKRMTVSTGKEVYQLTDLTWRFLMAIVEKAPHIATYEDLTQSVWEQDHVSDETIAQRLRQVRLALNDDPKSPTYIRTVRGKGYQLIAEISQVMADTSTTHHRYQKPVLWLGLATGIGLLSAVSILTWNHIDTSPAPEIARAEPSTLELIKRASEYRNRGQADANATAIGLYEKVLEVDENNQNALIGLSFSLSHKTSKYAGSSEWVEQAARLADKAILNDPNNAGAFAARGLADDARGRVSSAIDYYQRSLSLDPKDQSIRSSTAYLLQIQGQYHEALLLEKQALDAAEPTYFAEYQIALALEAVGLSMASDNWLERATLLRPDNVFLREHKATAFIKSGQYDSALKVLGDASTARASHAKLKAIAHLLKEQKVEALEAFEKAQNMAQANGRTCYECIAAPVTLKQTEDQTQIVSLLSTAQDAINNGDEWPTYRVELAYLLLANDQTSAALTSLEQAYDLGYRDWKWLETIPLLEPIQGHPEFKALTDKIKADLAVERDKIVSDMRLANLL